MEENPIIPFFLALAIIILSARVFGSLARRLGQPRVPGELIAGVILGPTLLNMPHWTMFEHVHLVEMVKPFAELGVIFLMFLIGLEVELKELAKVGRIAILAGFLGALLPVAMTIPAGLYFDYGFDVSLFAGVTLAATSVSISAQVLLELGHLRSKEGNALLATAIIDDVLAILLVSISLVIIGGNSGAEAEGNASIFLIMVKMVGFLTIALAIAWYIVPRAINRIYKVSTARQNFGMAALAIMTMLIFSWAAEFLGGVAPITGSFIAGLGISRVHHNIKHEIEETVGHIAYALLIPIFFISVGLETDLSTFPLSAAPLAIVLLVVAVISKIGGSGIGAKLGGFSATESLRVGVCMISRGEVGLIIASLGLSAGILQSDSAMFSSLFLVIVVTTVVTPIFVRMVFPDEEKRTVS